MDAGLKMWYSPCSNWLELTCTASAASLVDITANVSDQWRIPACACVVRKYHQEAGHALYDVWCCNLVNYYYVESSPVLPRATRA